MRASTTASTTASAAATGPRVDVGGRTRGAKRKLAADDGSSGDEDRPPPRGAPPTQLGGDELFDGTRLGISGTVRIAWWATQGGAVNCAICKKPMDLASTGDDAKSIDHVKAVSDLISGVEDHVVKTNGWHWRVVLKRDIQAIEDDTRNFVPAHQNCNSGKGGVQGRDNLSPQRTRCPVTNREYNDECDCGDAK